MRAAASKPQSGASRCWDSGAARAGTGVALLRVTLAACHGRPPAARRQRPGQANATPPAAARGGRGVWRPGRGAFDLDMVLHCKWLMLPMTLDMPDEGTR
jgi:hypothetical protein